MKIFKHVIVVIVVYLLFSCIGIGLYVFFKTSVPENLLEFSGRYRLYEALLVFLKFLPSLFLSAFLVGLSWSFGRSDSGQVERFSAIRIVFFKNVLALSVICIIVSGIASEVFLPSVYTAQKNMEQKEKNFESYLLLAEKSMKEDDYLYAKYYIDNALALKSNEQGALALRDTIDVFYSGMKQRARDQQRVQEAALLSVQDYGYTSPQLMEKAKTAYLKEEFFNAHYYASLLLEMVSKDDGNNQEARQLAADAWNKLQDNPAGIDSEQAEVYETKRRGYLAFVNEEYEKAYYIFSDLVEKYPSDLDISRYYLLSKEKMDSKYFFASEVENLMSFEQFKDVYFSVKNPDGGFYILYWKGGVVKEKSGNLIQYLRDFTLFSYNVKNELEYSLLAPYVKAVGFPLEHSSKAFQYYMQGDSKKTKKSSFFVPMLYFVSADDEKDDLYIEPKITYFGSSKEKLSLIDEGALQPIPSLLLAMPFDDFIQISQASMGIQVMPLTSLASFIKKANLYGFSRELYAQTFMSRISYPFVLLIVLILLAGISWNYKLGSRTLFKFIWLITLPLFTIILYFVLETMLYLLNLFSFVIIGVFSSIAPWVYLAFLCVLIFLSAIIFAALRSD